MAHAAIEWSEPELVQGMLAGEGSAWRAFADRYNGLIFTAIDRVLRCFPAYSSRVEREEVHATLLSSLLGREMHKLRVFEFERGVRLSTWISLLATNAARDHVRAAARRPTPVASATALVDMIEDITSSPLADLLSKEALARLVNTLQRLSLKDRQLVELLFVQSYEPEQIAAAMNISVKTVYTKKHKLMHRLQDALHA